MLRIMAVGYICIFVLQVRGVVLSIVAFSIGKWKRKMYARRPVGPELT